MYDHKIIFVLVFLVFCDICFLLSLIYFLPSSIFLSPSICISLCLSLCQTFWLSVSLCFCLCLILCLSIRLSLTICLSASVCLSSVCLSHQKDNEGETSPKFEPVTCLSFISKGNTLFTPLAAFKSHNSKTNMASRDLL